MKRPKVEAGRMKFWQLRFICNNHRNRMEAVLKSWNDQEYWHWWQNYESLSRSNQRDKLDAEMPRDLVAEVLKDFPQNFYRTGNVVRSYEFGTDFEAISYFEAYMTYGGSILEEVLEKGSFKIS